MSKPNLKVEARRRQQPILFYVALHFQNAFQIKLREPFTVTDWDVKRNTGLVDGMLA